MAKKKETGGRALKGYRELTQMIPEYIGTMGAATLAGYKGWIPNVANPLVVYETYFDLTGYELDDLTMMPIAATVQDPGIYSCSAATTPLHVFDIISQEKIEGGEVWNQILVDNAPGMLESENNFEQITFGNYRLFLGQATFTNPAGLTVFLPATQSQFGSGDAVSVQKLFCYRVILAPGAAEGTSLRIPASRFLLQANIIKESERVYLQRLKRSYELDQ